MKSQEKLSPGEDALPAHPPPKSCGVFSDIRSFFLHKPPIHTLVRFNSVEERQNYSHRIMQRMSINVDEYAVLNIHQIGINAPVLYVFEELEKWDGDSTCWPNHIAAVERQDGRLEHIKIYLLGKKKYPFPFKKSFFGLRYIPLFQVDKLKFQHLPPPSGHDNARYLLYECSGGYPIGIFAMYARSSIAPQQEKEPTQLFLVVGFDFYGKKDWQYKHIVNTTWEKIHNRVTANIMNRFKQLCEWRFQKIREGSNET